MPVPRRIRSSKHIIREPAVRKKPERMPHFFGISWEKATGGKKAELKRIIPRKPETARTLALSCVFDALKQLGAARTPIVSREEWTAYSEKGMQSPSMKALLGKFQARENAKRVLGEQEYNRAVRKLWGFAKVQKTAGFQRCKTIIETSDQIIKKIGF
ncbi:MAG: hypothetical protein Q7R70_02645 [Candidatus Diapherotrites archaeon]|nr:hypothetical protein [Candidatus Diapherotrites archaeon]